MLQQQRGCGTVSEFGRGIEGGSVTELGGCFAGREVVSGGRLQKKIISWSAARAKRRALDAIKNYNSSKHA
jgi:hypothetical protein